MIDLVDERVVLEYQADYMERNHRPKTDLTIERVVEYAEAQTEPFTRSQCWKACYGHYAVACQVLYSMEKAGLLVVVNPGGSPKYLLRSDLWEESKPVPRVIRSGITKKINVEFAQFGGDWAEGDMIVKWMNQHGVRATWAERDAFYGLEFPSGLVSSSRVREGDWVVRMPSGKFKVFEDKDFRELFQEPGHEIYYRSGK